MPADFIIKTGDLATFNPAFGTATVVVAPANMSGSAQIKVDGSVACVQGDEGKVRVPGCSYVSPPFATVPGVGTLTIDALGPDQTGQKTSSSQKPVILKGSTFQARFTVTVQAQLINPAGTFLDPVPIYSGTGQFVTTNVRSKGS